MFRSKPRNASLNPHWLCSRSTVRCLSGNISLSSCGKVMNDFMFPCQQTQHLQRESDVQHTRPSRGVGHVPTLAQLQHKPGHGPLRLLHNSPRAGTQVSHVVIECGRPYHWVNMTGAWTHVIHWDKAWDSLNNDRSS